ncbi:MAG TPA: hypothetical protein VMP01_28910, partial [Pirellulaceae bacterium]|nr:hypothetical protein [Pirellulaceae bacterium]
IFLSSIFLSYSPVRHSGVSDLPRGRVVSEPTMPETAATSRPDSSRHVISVLIVTAAILWNVAALTFASQKGFDWQSNEVAALLGLAFAQTGLAAGYFAWGRLNVVVRTGVLLAAIFASWRIAKLAADEPGLDWFTIQFITALATVTPLTISRLSGTRLLFGDETLDHVRTVRQFRIWDVLSWTTAIAMLAGASRWMAIGQTTNLQLLLLTLIEAVMICFCMVAPLGFKRMWLGVIAALGISVLFGAGFAMHARDPNPLLKMFVTEFIVITACVMVLRVGGYRLRSMDATVAK